MSWAQEAIKDVSNDDGENALKAEATDLADPITTAEVQEERKAGFTSNPKLRRVIEEHAMRVVKQYYKKQGFALKDRSKQCSYDFCYTDQQTQRFIEVKGSQQEWPAIILTPNEVAFAREHWQQMELCVVHSIMVDGQEKPTASGGILERFPRWNPDRHQLAATHYECELNRDPAGSNLRPPTIMSRGRASLSSHHLGQSPGLTPPPCRSMVIHPPGHLEDFLA